MVSFKDINIGDTVLLIPKGIAENGSAISEYFQQKNITEYTGLVIGKHQAVPILAILAPGYSQIFQDYYKSDYNTPDHIMEKYRGQNFFGVSEDQLVKIERVSGGLNIALGANDDNGGLSLL
jgi:hypothetical protein